MAVLSDATAPGYTWLFHVRNASGATEDPSFELNVILIHLNVSRHMWLVGTILNSKL